MTDKAKPRTASYDIDRVKTLLEITGLIARYGPGLEEVSGEARAELTDVNQAIIDAKAEAEPPVPPTKVEEVPPKSVPASGGTSGTKST